MWQQAKQLKNCLARFYFLPFPPARTAKFSFGGRGGNFYGHRGAVCL